MTASQGLVAGPASGLRTGAGAVGRALRGARLPAALLVLGLLGGCGDREGDVRATLGQWLLLGETRFYASSLKCSAGVFVLRAERLLPGIDTARSEPEAMTLAGIGRPFAMHFPGRSVSDISERMQSYDFTTGARIINSGVAARECLQDAQMNRYVEALRRPDGTVIFDPRTNGIVLIDPRAGLAFYTRGAG